MKLLIPDVRKPNQSVFRDVKDFTLSKASPHTTGYLAPWWKMLYYENSQRNLISSS